MLSDEQIYPCFLVLNRCKNYAEPYHFCKSAGSYSSEIVKISARAPKLNVTSAIYHPCLRYNFIHTANFSALASSYDWRSIPSALLI